MTRDASAVSLTPITGGTLNGTLGGGGMTPGTDGQILVTTAGKPTWSTPTFPTKVEVATDYVTKTDLSTQLAPLVSGIEHGAAVIDIAKKPTATAAEGDLYIVDPAPTDDFAGHANAIAFYENGAWVFTTPRANEAHLNEKDNQIYHWNGTKWNKIGSVASTGAPIIKSFSNQIGAKQVPAIVELEQANWRSIDLTVCLEIRDIASHLSFSLLQENGTYALTTTDSFQASQGLTYGGSSTGRSVFYPTKSTSFFPSDARFGMTWLPGPGANGNDQVSVTSSPYVVVRMSFVRMYDNYMTIDGSMYYGSYGGEGYNMHFKYMFGAAAGVPLVKKIQFNVQNTARIGACGQYTMLPWT